MNFKSTFLFLFLTAFLNWSNSVKAQDLQEIISENYTELEELYKHFHSHPELSFQEENTSKRMAEELKNLGFEVTEGIGGYGVVGIFKNGEGPTVMVRSDMDALPIEEETGAAYASTQSSVLNGEETPVMHACGHDMHITVMTGTAKALTELKDEWSGTLMMIAQPAEEIGAGAKAMIEDGLFERFPRPDYALALHVNSAMASGKAGITPGYAYASVDEIKIFVKGRGGHGAYPDLTVDPVIMASKLVLDLQTIISREISAFESAVLSVGAIRSGNSFNTVPGEAELRLTLRTFKHKIREKIIHRIHEMADAAGKSAGLPEEEWPQVVVDEDPLAEVYNSPELSEIIGVTFKQVLGEENFEDLIPVMYGEDFGQYGRVEPQIPILLYSIGAIETEKIKMQEQGLIDSIPSTHSSGFLPDVEPTLRTGVLTMSSAVLRLMNKE